MSGRRSRGDAPIVIVGGGIAGLACALRLERLAGDAGWRRPALLLERNDATGGKLVTEHMAGFVIDGGADVLLGSRPGAVDFCRRIAIERELRATEASTRRTYERRADGLHPARHYAAEVLLAPERGMARIPEATRRALQRTAIVPRVSVTGIQRTAHGRFLVRTSGGSVEATAVVLAVPAPVTAALLAEVAPTAAAALGSVAMRGAITCSVGYVATDCPSSMDGYGYLVPGAGLGEVSACTWTSSKLRGRAPSGHVLLRGYVHADGSVDGRAARAAVIQELRETMGITAAPLVAREFAWIGAIAVDPHEASARGREARVALEAVPGLILASATADGPGVPDAIAAGERAAESAWTHISLEHAA